MKAISLKPLRFFLYFLLSVSIVACSKDDENEPDIDVENILEYNGQSYNLNYGGLGKTDYDGTYSNYQFHVFQLNEGRDIVPIYLFLDLYSPNEEFKGGTFEFAGEETDVEGKAFIGNGFLIKNMTVSEENAEEVAYVVGGTVKVSGSGNNFELAFDLQTNNDKTIKGSYGGSFESVDEMEAVAQGQPMRVIKKLDIK